MTCMQVSVGIEGFVFELVVEDEVLFKASDAYLRTEPRVVVQTVRAISMRGAKL